MSSHLDKRNMKFCSDLKFEMIMSESRDKKSYKLKRRVGLEVENDRKNSVRSVKANSTLAPSVKIIY
jgi:hypothetical protein